MRNTIVRTPNFEMTLAKRSEDRMSESGFVYKCDLQLKMSYFEHGINFYVTGRAQVGLAEDNPEEVRIFKCFDNFSDADMAMICFVDLYKECKKHK